MAGKMNLPADVERLEVTVERELVAASLPLGDSTFFYRIRLPWTQIDSLLANVRKEGVNAATVYPGYAGVVQALLEEDVRVNIP